MFDLTTLSAKAPDMGKAIDNLSKYGGNVTLSGFIIVFAMLVLLVVIISVFGVMMSRLNGNKVPKATKVKVEKPIPAKTVAANVQNDNDEGVIAAISAAIMMMYEGTGKKPVIRSIKPAVTGRSAWKQAGVVNNVRSF